MDGKVSAENDSHLQSCPTCTNLVQELRLIATEARQLAWDEQTLYEPSVRVWNGIEAALASERLADRTIAFPLAPHRSKWMLWGWAAAVAAALAFTFGTIQFLHLNSAPPVVAKAPAAFDANDARLLATVGAHSQQMKQVYADNLNNVNTYIKDAKKSLDEDPSSQEAAEYLREAYAQKAMLYEMGTEHSLE